jgi:hypothetical protein
MDSLPKLHPFRVCPSSDYSRRRRRAGPVVDRELPVDLLAHFLKHEARYDSSRRLK